MASLQELLAEEGFRRRNATKPRKKEENVTQEDSLSVPIFICHDRRSTGLSKRHAGSTRRNGSSSQLSSVQTESSVVSSRRTGTKLEKLSTKSCVPAEVKGEGPAIGNVEVSAVISILGGYIGRYFKDAQFRSRIQKICQSCLAQKKEMEDEILNKLELGMENIEELAERARLTKESRMKILRNSIRLLSIVESLNSPESKNGFTCGISNSHLSACAQFYLSIVYKLDKNDRVSARHLLQVFCDSPSLARSHLLPDLWEHFFLPHLLHLKVWYTKEVDAMDSSGHNLSGRRMKLLRKVYNEKMDKGTVQFALYYKEWLKVGVKAPPVPSVALPSRASYGNSRENLDSYDPEPPINKRLYQAIFGNSVKQLSVAYEDHYEYLKHKEDDLHTNGVLISEGARNNIIDDRKSIIYHGDDTFQGMSSIRMPEKPKASSLSGVHKPDYFRFLSCRSQSSTGVTLPDSLMKDEIKTRVMEDHSPLSNLKYAVKVICDTDSLTECEIAVRVVSKFWLDSHGDSIVETALSKEPVIEGLLELLYASEDVEVMELAISILAELVVKNDINGHILLTLDPQLGIFMRLLKNNSLFLKAAVLLYVLKPKAKQMPSPNWIPLVLKVLECGDQLQTLFTIQCSPHAAVFYILDQLMTGFDRDRNVENSKQIIMLGGLKLLIKRLQAGDIHEKKTAVLLLYLCIQADGGCRHYVASNIKKTSLVELLMDSRNSAGNALALLVELVCLNRRTHINNFLEGLITQGSLNVMHILLVYLQRAPPEQRSLIAAILLHLDLLGDPLQSSVYREEAIDALVEALECNFHNELVCEQLARALSILGGRFSHLGKSSVEKWLLRQAGYTIDDSFTGKRMILAEWTTEDEEEKAAYDWQRKAASVLVSGSQGFLGGLVKSKANGNPCLARACLVTITWISITIVSICGPNFMPKIFSVLLSCALESLNYDRDIEERVMASLTMWSLAQNSVCLSMLSPLRKDLENLLQNLAHVTWTAKELLSLLRSVSIR